jgi:hypothetical protein
VALVGPAAGEFRCEITEGAVVATRPSGRARKASREWLSPPKEAISSMALATGASGICSLGEGRPPDFPALALKIP